VAVVVAYGRILQRIPQRAPPRLRECTFLAPAKFVGRAGQLGHRHGELQTGVTTMQIVPELDAGPIS